jgi:hypothetical protein
LLRADANHESVFDDATTHIAVQHEGDAAKHFFL